MSDLKALRQRLAREIFKAGVSAEHPQYAEAILLQYAEAVLGEPSIFDQSALDAASMAVHLMLLREGSSWGTKACEEMGRVFMVAYEREMASQRLKEIK